MAQLLTAAAAADSGGSAIDLSSPPLMRGHIPGSQPWPALPNMASRIAKVRPETNLDVCNLNYRWLVLVTWIVHVPGYIGCANCTPNTVDRWPKILQITQKWWRVCDDECVTRESIFRGGREVNLERGSAGTQTRIRESKFYIGTRERGTWKHNLEKRDATAFKERAPISGPIYPMESK